jgi:hypothetical protein
MKRRKGLERCAARQRLWIFKQSLKAHIGLAAYLAAPAAARFHSGQRGASSRAKPDTRREDPT